MRIKVLALIVAVVSFSSNATDIAAAQEAVAHASRMADAAQGSVDSAQSSYGQGTVQGWADTSNRAGAFRAQAMSDLNAANQNLTNAVNTPKTINQISHVGEVTQATGVIGGGVQVGITGPVTKTITNIDTSGLKNAPKPAPANFGNAVQGVNPNQPTINVAASTLSPSTKVKTDKGIVKAGTLPKNTQVTVAFNSAFNVSHNGGNQHSVSRGAGEHGTGNGANNAANSHSAHGLGGSESIGGGHSGGGFHY